MAEETVVVQTSTAVGRAALPAPLRQTCIGSALAILIGLVVAPPLLAALTTQGLPQFYLVRQDTVWLAVTVALLLALAGLRLPVRRLAALPPPDAGPTAWIAAALVVMIAAAGTFLALRGFALSRDEMMADFDATILRTGRLVAALPPDFRALRDALIPEFLLPVPGGAFWVSSYLPGNAGLRAAVGLVVDPGWTSPVLAGLAVLALWRCGRRLWPDRPDATVVAVLLLAGSTQVLVTAMTAFAMTAHLALNLAWLALYLRDDRRGHCGAVAVGALACGLHQVVFHPLFVAPFVLHLLMRRRFRLALLYIAAYGVICLFWIAYWRLVLQAEGAGGAAAQVGADWFATRVLQLLADFSLGGLALMIANALRFVAWQHLLLLPLATLAWGAIRRDEGIARPLAGGIVLTLLAVFVLLPYQGHGWGYRYLHGLIGNACLLAGYGWIAATARADAGERAAAAVAVGLAATLAILVMLPARIAQAVQMMAPYRAAMAAIAATPADIVMVDRGGLAFGHDLVRNDPFLRNRPLVLDLGAVDAAHLTALCSRHTVAVLDRRQGRALGIMADETSDPGGDRDRAARRDQMRLLGCGTDLPIAGDAKTVR